MDFLPRLGVALLFTLPGIALMVWATSFPAFNGLWGLLEEFLPEGIRYTLRRVVNTLLGLALVAIGVLFFLFAGSAPQANTTSPPAIDKASMASPATNSSNSSTSNSAANSTGHSDNGSTAPATTDTNGANSE